MVPLVQSSVDSLVKVFGEKAENGKSFEFFRYNSSIMTPVYYHNNMPNTLDNSTPIENVHCLIHFLLW